MEGLGVGSRSLEDMLREADFVSAHAPHTKGTHHLMSDAQFALMKPTAIFVNTGRGRVVDEPALIRALQEGKIAAAGLDVLEDEPPDPNNPLLKMDERARDAAHGVLLGRGVRGEPAPGGPGGGGDPERQAPAQLRQPRGAGPDRAEVVP